MNQVTCSVEECENTPQARGLCSKHYTRLRRSGDPTKGNPRNTSPEKTFAQKTIRSGECIYWVGSKDSSGYGQIWTGEKLIMVHRYAWQKERGQIPDGFEIDHICHARHCVNIEHLRLATRGQNTSHMNGAHSHNKNSGMRNVHKHGNAWRVVVTKDATRHYFGRYSVIEEAAQVAEQARKDLFGEFAGKG